MLTSIAATAVALEIEEKAKGDAGQKGDRGDPGKPGIGITGIEDRGDEIVLMLSDLTIHRFKKPQALHGEDGKDGVGIQTARIEGVDLIIVLTDGTEINAGRVVGRDGEPGREGPRGRNGLGIDKQRTRIDDRDHFILAFDDGTEKDIGFVGQLSQPVMIGSTGITTGDARRVAKEEANKLLNTEKVVTITGDYTASVEDDIVLADATSGPIEVTLFTAVGRKKPLHIKRINTNANDVTITPQSGETIELESQRILNASLWSVRLISDQSNWWET